MGNNEPDYKDNLYFAPNRITTWEELLDFAKDFDWTYFAMTKNAFAIDDFIFYKKGKITKDDGKFIADKRSYEQMKNIIVNLFG